MARGIQQTLAGLTLALFALLVPPPAHAQDTLEAPGIVALTATERAPFSGMLIRSEDLVRWRLEIERLRQELELLRVASERRELLLEQRRSVDLEACEARVTLHDGLYQARIREAVVTAAEQSSNDRKTIRRLAAWSVLWFVAGAVVGVGVGRAADR